MASGRPQKARAGAVTPTKVANAALSFAPTLWAAADKLRGNMDAAEYKHVALGLIFLKYISDRFEERRQEILAEPDTPVDLKEELTEDRDAYTAENVFWVPTTARWTYLKEHATSVEPTIGVLVDNAMSELEKENTSLRGVLSRNYARPELDQAKLGEVIELFSNLAFKDEHHGQDVLGRVYEYFSVSSLSPRANEEASSTRRVPSFSCL